MSLFSRLRREAKYDRRRILDRAARAARTRTRRGRLRAIELYRRVLEVEPDNPDVLRKIAQLAARTNQTAEACASYHQAATAFVARGFIDKAIGVYRDAVSALPHEVAIWKAIAALERKRGPDAAAVAALLEARRAFRRRRDRRQAIELLWEARRIDSQHLEVNLELASLLGREGALARERALGMLDDLLAAHRACIPRIRAQQFRISPTPARAWLWISARLAAS